MHNTTLSDSPVEATSTPSNGLQVTGATGATEVTSSKVRVSTTLDGRQPAAPSIAPGATPGGYIPLDAFGITPVPIGDEQALNFNVPPYRYAGETYNRLGVTSNGYLVAGGTSGAVDISFMPQTLPDPARPNNVLAPFWTDLDGTGAPGIFIATLTDGVDTWIVTEWRVNVFGTTSSRVFQSWIGINGVEDISFTYNPANLPAAPPAGYGLTVGAENIDGTAGAQIAGLPTQDLRVTSTPGVPGESYTYTYELKANKTGNRTTRTDMTTPLVRGTTTEVDTINVTN